MATGDFPVGRHRPNLPAIVAPACTGRSRRSVERSQARRSDMHLKETPDVSFPGVVENPPVEDVVVLADSAGVALGVQRTFSARVRSVRDDGSGLIASK